MADTAYRETASTPEDGASKSQGELVYRQNLWTRITHWTWAVSLLFLLMSGLQIFNAHPTLYIGNQSGFSFDNQVLAMGAIRSDNGVVGITRVFGREFDTTGVFGVSTYGDQVVRRGFPSWATLPSYQDLGTGRVVHFFFAWVLVIALTGWLVGSIINGHLRHDIALRREDVAKLPRDIADHAKLKFHHTREYNTLQKISYGGIMFVVFPLIVATGLAMSPTMNAAIPFLADLFGGRQTARTIHFCMMLMLVGFFIVHIAMVIAAGPINELRSIITGRYRIDPKSGSDTEDMGA